MSSLQNNAQPQTKDIQTFLSPLLLLKRTAWALKGDLLPLSWSQQTRWSHNQQPVTMTDITSFLLQLPINKTLSNGAEKAWASATWVEKEE